MKNLFFQDLEIKEGRIWAAISYVGPLCIFPFIFRRENNFALYHARHGLVIFVLEIAVFILSVVPGVGMFLKVVGSVLFSILIFMGVLQALLGNYVEFPIISEMAQKITL